jgi:hypothetical protein
MMDSVDKMCEFINSKEKQQEAKDNPDERKTIGCSALSVYGWFLVGLFTSQWFLCAIYLTLGFIEMAVKKAFPYTRRPVEFVIGGAIDAFIALLIIINSLWLHIDFYQKFVALFN